MYLQKRIPISLFSSIIIIVLLTTLHFKKVEGEPIALAITSIAVGIAGIASDIYYSSNDDIGEVASQKIEEVIKRQADNGLTPLHKLDPELREILGAQGRIEESPPSKYYST